MDNTEKGEIRRPSMNRYTMKKYASIIYSMLLLIASGQAIYAENRHADRDFHVGPVANDHKEHRHAEHGHEAEHHHQEHHR